MDTLTNLSAYLTLYRCVLFVGCHIRKVLHERLILGQDPEYDWCQPQWADAMLQMSPWIAMYFPELLSELIADWIEATHGP